MKNVSFYPQSSNNTNDRVSVRFDQRGFGNPNSQTPTSPFFEITCAEWVFFFLASFLISFLFFQTRRCIGGLVCIEGLVPRRQPSPTPRLTNGAVLSLRRRMVLEIPSAVHKCRSHRVNLSEAASNFLSSTSWL